MNQTTAPMTEPQVKYITKLARKQMSRIGFVYFAGTILLVALELSLSMLFLFGNPDGDYDSSILIFFNLILRFILGYPLMLCLIHLVKKGKPIPQKKMKAGSVFIAFFMAYAMAMITNIIGLLLTSIINAFQSGVDTTNLQDTLLALPSVWLVLFVCVGAPIFEELIFRKALVDRAIYCGEGIAIAMSGVMFGLFHGNLNQFVYAAALGAFFAFIYVRTGKIRYTMILHAMVNSMATIGTLLLKMFSEGTTGYLEGTETLASVSSLDLYGLLRDPLSGAMYLGGALGLCVWLLAIAAFVITGIILWIVKGKKLFLLPSRDLSVPKGKHFLTAFLNPGMICFSIVWILLIGSSLFG
ncbi:MAG: CPBP family intramembrane metalloprotease [Lachnospiraceae bacterium]|nr:CPBP family intramembrane metalloprotease [Lachnospiraceae bacterium]